MDALWLRASCDAELVSVTRAVPLNDSLWVGVAVAALEAVALDEPLTLNDASVLCDAVSDAEADPESDRELLPAALAVSVPLALGVPLRVTRVIVFVVLSVLVVVPSGDSVSVALEGELPDGVGDLLSCDLVDDGRVPLPDSESVTVPLDERVSLCALDGVDVDDCCPLTVSVHDTVDDPVIVRDRVGTSLSESLAVGVCDGVALRRVRDGESVGVRDALNSSVAVTDFVSSQVVVCDDVRLRLRLSPLREALGLREPDDVIVHSTLRDTVALGASVHDADQLADDVRDSALVPPLRDGDPLRVALGLLVSVTLRLGDAVSDATAESVDDALRPTPVEEPVPERDTVRDGL